MLIQSSIAQRSQPLKTSPLGHRGGSNSSFRTAQVERLSGNPLALSQKTLLRGTARLSRP